MSLICKVELSNPVSRFEPLRDNSSIVGNLELGSSFGLLLALSHIRKRH